MSISIVEKKSGVVLAKGEAGSPSVLKFEGNLYFSPDAINAKNLKVTARTYTCPYKGTCNWVDFVSDSGETAKDVAWVYPNPKPGHEAIKDRYGFYEGTRGGTRQEG